MEETMTAMEAARTLGYSPNYLYQLLLAGKLSANKVDGTWRVEVRAVRERLQAIEQRRGR